MRRVEIDEAETQLSHLIDQAESGGNVVIARSGVPSGNANPGQIGLLKGKFVIPEDFDDPLPDELLQLFEGVGE